MWIERLTVSEDASAGAWIGPRLGGDFGAVTRTVPRDYPAYVRICHPAANSNGEPVRWSQVAEVTRRKAHRLMQWHALVGSPDYLNFKGSLWPGEDPPRGELAPHVLGALCDLLGGYTAHPESCNFGLWEGWGWVEGSSEIARFQVAGTGGARTESSTERVASPFSQDELERPRLRLPARNYLLLSGPLSTATLIGNLDATGHNWLQSPNLFWPADRAWCVASEIDFDSTLVGGTAQLIQAILQNPAFDAWTIDPDDSLAYDADHVNLIS